MDYKRKYENAQKRNVELVGEIDNLKEKIADLEGERDFLKNFNTESGNKAKGLMIEIEVLKKQLADSVAETQRINAKYELAVKAMKKMQRAYKKKFKEIIAEAKKDL